MGVHTLEQTLLLEPIVSVAHRGSKLMKSVRERADHVRDIQSGPGIKFAAIMFVIYLPEFSRSKSNV